MYDIFFLWRCDALCVMYFPPALHVTHNILIECFEKKLGMIKNQPKLSETQQKRKVRTHQRKTNDY